MLPVSRLSFFLATLTAAANVCPPVLEADMVFVVDSDGSTGNENYHCFYDLMINIISRFQLGKDLTRVGLVSYDTSPKTLVPLSFDKEMILKRIRNIEYRHNTVDTIVCLGVALGLFNSSEPREKKAKSIVVLVTDGTAKKREFTVRTAQRLKDKGIIMFTVGFNPRTDPVELQDVASKPQYYLESNSYDDYLEFAQELVNLFCYDDQERNNVK